MLCIRDKIQTLVEVGLFHVVGAGALSNLVLFLANIAIARFLSQADYGVFSYANNLYTIVLLFMAFGLLSGMLQFCAENRSDTEKRQIYWYSFTRGLFISLIMALLVMVVGLLVKMPIPDAGACFAMFAPIVVFEFFFQYASIALRSKKDNKRYAYLQLIKTLSYFTFACSGALLGGICGTMVGRYFAYVVSLVCAFFLLRQVGLVPVVMGGLSKLMRKDLWGYSLPTCMSSAMNLLTYMLDLFLVGLFLNSAVDVALYQVGVMIPEGIAFIPSSVIVAVMPYFIEHNHDKLWLMAKSKLLVFVSFLAYSMAAALLILLAPFIIELLWGSEYVAAAGVFRILSVCFVFNAMRLTCTNLLCALREVKSNLVISSISLMANVAVCVFAIPRFGIIGAAFAPMTVSVIASTISLYLYFSAVGKVHPMQ